MNNFLAHRRQFVISRQKFEMEGWKHYNLENELFLSFQEDLLFNVRLPQRTVVLGLELLDGCSGRYVKIDGTTLRGDALGLLPVYYGFGPSGPVVSSSPALIGLLTESERDIRGIEGTSIINGWFTWIPLPSSPFPGIQRLFADQSIDLVTLKVSAVEKRITASGDIDHGTERLAGYLVDFARALPDARIAVALTAGLDSRLIFAAFLASGVKFETFTILKPGITKIDMRVAIELAKKFGIKHTILSGAVESAEFTAMCDMHNGPLAAAERLNSKLAGYYHEFDSNTLVVRGHCFEVGRGFFNNFLGDLEFSSVTAEKMISRLGVKGREDVALGRALVEWIDWRSKHSLGLDLSDSFYFDQRLGGWLSDKEQFLDGFPFIDVQPGNSDIVFSSLFSAENLNDRRSGVIQRGAVRLLCPTAFDIPINPPSGSKRIKMATKGLIKQIFPNWRTLKALMQKK